MSERLEYQGNPLPSGLPGVGDASVVDINLPGISNVVIPTKFGPVVDIPTTSTSQPPIPTAPVGSNPANPPTTEVVTPGPAPAPRITPGGALAGSGGVWRSFYICENGAPKLYYFFTRK